IENALARLQIEVAGRLVGQEEQRIGQQGPRDGHPLLLAAGELIRKMLRARRESQLAEETVRLLHRTLRLHSSDPPWHGHVLQRRELRQQVMKLKDETDLAVPKRRQVVVGHRGQLSSI